VPPPRGARALPVTQTRPCVARRRCVLDWRRRRARRRPPPPRAPRPPPTRGHRGGPVGGRQRT